MGGRVEQLPYYTYKDYVHWEDQWELIEGRRVEQPTAVYEHQIIATRLIVAFSNKLEDFPKYKVCQPLDYKVTKNTVLQPDMFIADRKPRSKYLDFPPVLIAEVLSPSTMARDKMEKFNIYESQGVLYYLILSPVIQQVEIYHCENGKYVLKAKGKDILFTFEFADCRAEINFGKIWPDDAD